MYLQKKMASVAKRYFVRIVERTNIRIRKVLLILFKSKKKETYIERTYKQRCK